MSSPLHAVISRHPVLMGIRRDLASEIGVRYSTVAGEWALDLATIVIRHWHWSVSHGDDYTELLLRSLVSPIWQATAKMTGGSRVESGAELFVCRDRALVVETTLYAVIGTNGALQDAARGYYGLSGLPQVASLAELLTTLRSLTRALTHPAPARYLVEKVRGKIEDRERLRPQRVGHGRTVISLAGLNEDTIEIAGEIATDVDYVRPSLLALADVLRATGDPKDARAAGVMMRVLNGHKKYDIGADYQFLHFYLRDPRIRGLALEVGLVPPGHSGHHGRRRRSARGGYMAPPTWYVEPRRTPTAPEARVVHRYSGEDLEEYYRIGYVALPFSENKKSVDVSSKTRVSAPE